MVFRKNPKYWKIKFFGMYVCIVGVFCIISCYFEYRIRIDAWHVGTVTTAMLMENTIVAARRQRNHYVSAFGPLHTSTNVAMITQRVDKVAKSEKDA